ncbi:MAG: polyamine ABC transporter substrate-binding protein [Gammaproteobacteria bacterium]
MATDTWRACALGWTAYLALASAAAPAKELTILSYSDYIDPDVVAEFETQSAASIKWVYFESEYEENKILTDAAGTGYDLVMLSGERIAGHARRQWLARIEPDRIPNRRHVATRWREAYPLAEKHCVPYVWGGYGVAYRSDLVKSPPTSWQAFLQPDEAWRGRIAMMRDARDLIGVALKSLGRSVNTSERAILREAGDRLLIQKPFVAAYDYINTTETSALVSGDLWLAFTYNGDALVLKEHEPAIEFVYPEEGMGLWVDYWCVMAKGPQTELALAFLDFTNRPEMAARIAEYIQFATPNEAAMALVSEEYRDNPLIFPSSEVLEKSEFYRALAPRATKTVNEVRSLIIRE